MNQGRRRTTFRPGSRISQSAVRDASPGPQIQTTEGPAAEHRRSTEAQAVAAHASPPGGRAKPLRRWSVAELLAGAVSRPPTGAVAR